jgi:beta-glucosidase
MRPQTSLQISLALAGLVCVLTNFPAQAQESCAKRLTPQQADSRVDRLIDAMTLKEKVDQLQDRAPGIPRLGLPAYNWWNEGLHGIARNGYATVFPQAIGLAATWDAELLRGVGDTVSTEARAKFNSRPKGDSLRYAGLTIWSPNINIFRDPRWGRGQETYGEDPFLTASLGSAYVRGLQGNDPYFLKADATPKHFVAHSGPEEGRDSFNAKVTPHDLEDTYLQAFHALIGPAQAAALMCSYNAINATPSCADAGLLQTKVRGEWGFRGYVVSDCDAVGNLTAFQHYTSDAAHGAAAALKAGVDLDCGNSYLALADAVRQHLVNVADVNQALHRLLLARLRLGALTAAECSPYDAIKPSENDSATNRALALRAAEESIVLLQNDGVLPLKSTRKIAVIGPTADMLKVLEANYHGTASHPVTPLEGLRKTFASVAYAQGSLLAEGVSIPVPRTALQPGSTIDSAQGLTAEYFARANFEGIPVIRTVAKVDLDLDRVAPIPQLAGHPYAVRWSGFLLPPAPGDYTLHVNIERCWDCTRHDSFRLLIDGAVVLENDGSHAEPNTFVLHSPLRTAHAVRLELRHTGDDEGIALEWEPPAEALLAEALATAKDAEAIVVFAGLSPDLEGEALQLHLDGFNGGDRTTLDLPAAQRTLIERLRTLHKPMVLVLNSGSALSLDPVSSHAAAILEAWYPGEEGGDAIASILSGSTNPSGRLPVTFYRSVSDLPAFTDYAMNHRTYRYYDGPVLYPFGFGLSYTQFEYGSTVVSTKNLSSSKPLTISTTLRNRGKVSGSEVVELYLIPPSLPGAPRLTLQGIQRVTLQPGETRKMSFTLKPEQLTTVDPKGERSVRTGRYRVVIAGQQPALDGAPGVAFDVIP